MIGLSLIAIIGSIFLAGAYSGFETGSYLLNRVRLRFRVSDRDHRALLLERTLRDPTLFIATVLVGHNVAVYVASATIVNIDLGMYDETVVPTTLKYNLAGAYRKSGDLPKAIELYTTVIQEDSQFVRAHVSMGVACMQLPDCRPYARPGLLVARRLALDQHDSVSLRYVESLLAELDAQP